MKQKQSPQPKGLKKIIRQRLVFILFGGALFLILLFSAAQFSINLRMFRERQLELTRSLKHSIMWQIRDADDTIRFLVESGNRDYQEIQSRMFSAYQMHSYFNRLILLSDEGQVISTEPGSLPLTDYSALLRGGNNFSGLFSTVSLPYVDQKTGAVTVDFRQKMENGNYVVGQLDLSFLQSIIRRSLEDSTGARKLIITDLYGNILAHPRREYVEQQVNIGGTALIQDLQAGADVELGGFYSILDRSYYTVAAKLPALGWFLIDATLIDSILSELGRTLAAIVGLFALFILLWSFFVGNLVNRKVVVPLNRFIEALNSSVAAEAPVSIEQRISEYREFIELQGTFNSMAEKVRLRDRTLQKFKMAVQQAGFAIYITDKDGYIEYVNPAFEWTTGFRRDEVIGRKPNILSSGEMSQAYYENLWSVILSGEIWEEEIINRRKDGSTYYGHQTIAPIFNDEGEITSFVALQSDVSESKRAAQKIQESEELYKSLFQLAADSIMLIKPHNGKIVQFNDEAYRKLGYTEDEFRDLRVSDFEANESEAETRSHIEQIMRSGHGSFESMHRTKQGKLLNVIKMVSLISYQNEPHLLTISHDITERKLNEERIRRSEAKYRLLAENSTDMISKHTPSGVYTYVSPVCTNLLGFEPEDLIGTSAYDYFHPEDLQQIQNSHSSINAKNNIATVIYRIRRKDGSYTWFETTSRLLVDDETGVAEEIVAISRDVSYRKQIEEQLRQAKEEAEAANQAKSDFIANVSHEIRTPMNAVLGYNQLLASMITDSQARTYIHAIDKSSNVLLELINDILDLSKIEAGRLSLEYGETDVRYIVADIEQIFYLSIEQKGLKFRTEIDDSVPKLIFLDEARLRQILLNLAGNAVKFTDKGEIKLSAYGEPVSGEADKINLHLQISDTGIGIETTQLTRIFEAFRQQEGQSTRKYGGTGLGLSISKRLVEAMNGTIEVESEIGQGSLFSVHFFGVEVVQEYEAKTPRPETASTGRDEISEVHELSEGVLSKDIESAETLLKTLESSYIPRWGNLRTTMFIDEVQKFAQDLAELAEVHRAEYLRYYARSLITAAEQFQVDNLERLMQDFGFLVEKLRDSIYSL